MKAFGWIVAILIVLYLVGRGLKSKPADQQAAAPGPATKTPADNLIDMTSNLASTTGAIVYEMANKFATEKNIDLTDGRPLTQASATPGDLITATRPVDEVLSGRTPNSDDRIPRAEYQWWPNVLYTSRPGFADHYPDENGECVCGNGCITITVNE
ncbi:MAG TPA: hypothetical protein PJ995_21550 [Cyclobacteriaceae bacterium]|nr:hypothetical protein [Cyclobacteriaceae bacterium]HMX02937.1 hypothetical protein [Cyclobacteriaceae bacterium]